MMGKDVNGVPGISFWNNWIRAGALKYIYSIFEIHLLTFYEFLHELYCIYKP